MKAIVLEGVKRSFGGKEVLRGVTASAEKGKVVGLLGRNGEGKSTLFRIMLDLLEADAGRVEVLGLKPDGSAAIRGKAGWVPERPVFHEFMSAAEVFDLRRKFFPSWSRERAMGLSKRLGLDPSVKVAGASKGTLAKLAWVCATAHDPELLLLDEPTSGLDALVREEILESMVGELHEQGKTILVANHHMEELANLLDEVWVLSGGRITAVHQAQALRSGPRRLRGRLKKNAGADGLAVIPMSADGPLVEWAALDEAAAKAAAGRFEAFEESPLAMPQTLALLLKEPRP